MSFFIILSDPIASSTTRIVLSEIGMFVNPVATFVLMGLLNRTVHLFYAKHRQFTAVSHCKTDDIARTCGERERHISLWYPKVDRVCNHSAGQLNPLSLKCINSHLSHWWRPLLLVSYNWIQEGAMIASRFSEPCMCEMRGDAVAPEQQSS
jgi:hypothetical protein